MNDIREFTESIIAYWVSKGTQCAFDGITALPLEEMSKPCQGLLTTDNGRFLRLWFECSNECICYSAGSRDDAKRSGRRWFPINKGGSSRRWYGNHEYVVDWQFDGRNCPPTPWGSGGKAVNGW